jgi:cytochrome P450
MSPRLTLAGIRGRPPLPPGPHMPGVVQAVEWTRRPLSFMESCQRRYGEIFTLRVQRGATWVVLCDPEDVKRVFTAAPETLGVSEANPLLGPLLGPRSVMLLEEPEHMPRRKLMLGPFHGPEMAGYGEIVAEVTRREVASWPAGQPFELWPRMQAITLEAIMRVVFGSVQSENLERVRDLLRQLTDWLNDPRRLSLLAVFGPRLITRNSSFRSTRDAIATMVLAEVNHRREQPEAGEGVVALLARARYEDGSPLSAKDVSDELITLLSDGPTSTSLAWAFERLLRHPDKLERLREEVLGEEDDAYMEAVIRETMRLCPPVPVVARRLTQEMRLGGYAIPAGVTVAPCVYLMHRREDVYDRPGDFLPERFLERAPGTYTWIPFGGGARRCLAASFAMLEMKHVLHTVLSEVELLPGEQPAERAAMSSIAFAPGNRALAVAARR